MDKKFVLTKVREITTGFIFYNDKIDEIKCYEEASIIGNIYVGRISNILKNISAIFVDISKDETCYLSFEDYKLEKTPKLGDEIIVQITKDKIKSKQASVSMDLSITGKYIVVNTTGCVGVSSKVKSGEERERLKSLFIRALEKYKLECDVNTLKMVEDISFGAIVRTDAIIVDEAEVFDEAIDLLEKLSKTIQRAKCSKAYTCAYEANKAYYLDLKKLIKNGFSFVTDIDEIYNQVMQDPDLYGCDNVHLHKDDISLNTLYGINTIIRKSLQRNVYLKSGAYLVIEPTEAMTVIDVNSGKAIKGSNKEDIILKINKEAALEIAKQLKIRNMSGIVLVDFISMKEAGNDEVLLDYLRKCVSGDTVPVSVIDMTRLGLVEITRKKVRRPLYQIEKFRGIE